MRPRIATTWIMLALGALLLCATAPAVFAQGQESGIAVAGPRNAPATATGEPVDAPRTPIAGVQAPGPDRYDRVWVRRYGPKRPSCVLVLVPGSPAGQGGFAWVAQQIASRVDGLAVWALDRRSNAFEDVSAFERGTADQALGFYFGDQPFEGARFAPIEDSEAGYVRRWGARTALRDLHRVIRKASRGGRRCVILGGHSFGPLQVQAYAAWDFGGRAGFRDLDALVLIDGGLFNAFRRLLVQSGFPPFGNVAQARDRIEALKTQSPFGSDESVPGVPEWMIGVVPELICKYALADPEAPSALQQQGLAELALAEPPDFPVTNEALAGLFSDGLGPQGARIGYLAASGDPRPWVDGPRSSVARFCATFTQEPGNGMEWYFPIRLEIDVAQGLQPLRPSATTRFLGLRPFHLSEIDLPLYVIQTRLSDGGVLRGARRMIRKSRIRHHKLVDASQMKHYDPLMSVPSRNRFLKSVIPFLRNAMRQR